MNGKTVIEMIGAQAFLPHFYHPDADTAARFLDARGIAVEVEQTFRTIRAVREV